MFSSLPSLNGQPGKACPKGKSRLQEKQSEDKITLVTERDFRKAVWTRDQDHCRCCLRKVIKTIERVVNAGHVHHIHGRAGDLRFESRAALLLCLGCHEKVTGRVNERWGIEPATKTGWFTFPGNPVHYINANKRVLFTRLT